MSTGDLAARARSCLLAGATGDAWGGPYENRHSLGLTPFPERPRFSDDTWLTLATCESIVENNGIVDPARLADTFRRWFLARRFSGLGASTLKALRDLAAGGHWALAGARGEFASGAGAAMRIAPLAFVLDPAQKFTRTVVRDVARITHHSDEAYAGALAVMVAVRTCASQGKVPADLIGLVARQLPDTRVRDRLEALTGRDSLETVARLGNSGYVVDAVPLALVVATRLAREGVAAVVERAVSLGGDTDTIASIGAQVVGASGEDPPLDLLGRVSGFAAVNAGIARFAEQLDRGLG